MRPYYTLPFSKGQKDITFYLNVDLNSNIRMDRWNDVEGKGIDLNSPVVGDVCGVAEDDNHTTNESGDIGTDASDAIDKSILSTVINRKKFKVDRPTTINQLFELAMKGFFVKGIQIGDLKTQDLFQIALSPPVRCRNVFEYLKYRNKPREELVEIIQDSIVNVGLSLNDNNLFTKEDITPNEASKDLVNVEDYSLENYIDKVQPGIGTDELFFIVTRGYSLNNPELIKRLERYKLFPMLPPQIKRIFITIYGNRLKYAQTSNPHPLDHPLHVYLSAIEYPDAALAASIVIGMEIPDGSDYNLYFLDTLEDYFTSFVSGLQLSLNGKLPSLEETINLDRDQIETFKIKYGLGPDFVFNERLDRIAHLYK